jgi:gas vesicle protein
MSTTTSRPADGGAQDASSTAQQAKDKVQDTAQQAAGQARSRVSEQVDERSTQAGEQVGSTAGDIRTVAQQLREQGKDQPAKLAEQAADRAESLADYLTRADGDSILRDVEDFGRRQPWAVMFGGLAAGFLASRFLKASSSRRAESASPSPVGGRSNGGFTGTYGEPAGYQPPTRQPGTVPPVDVDPARGTGTVPPRDAF